MNDGCYGMNGQYRVDTAKYLVGEIVDFDEVIFVNGHSKYYKSKEQLERNVGFAYNIWNTIIFRKDGSRVKVVEFETPRPTTCGSVVSLMLGRDSHDE